MAEQVDATDISVANLTALQLIQTARAHSWHYAGDTIRHFGPLLRELATIDPTLVQVTGSDLGANSNDLLGLVWAAAAEAGDRIAALTLRVAELERLVRSLT